MDPMKPEQLDLLSYKPTRFFVYVIENSVDGKKYVGKAADVEFRWKQHQYAAQQPRYRSYLYNAMRAHGVDKFSVRTVHECVSEAEAFRQEVLYIEKFGCMAPFGYNMTAGGEGATKYLLSREETLSQMRQFAGAWLAVNGQRITAREWEANRPAHLPPSADCRRRVGCTLFQALLSESDYAEMQREIALKRAAAAVQSISPEERRANGQRGAATRNARMTPEQLHASMASMRSKIQNRTAGVAAISPEQRQVFARMGGAATARIVQAMTPEQKRERTAAARASVASRLAQMTPEQRQERMAKVRAGRRAKRGESA
jgi:predicted GIY-YIG superfamily endonuclease